MQHCLTLNLFVSCFPLWDHKSSTYLILSYTTLVTHTLLVNQVISSIWKWCAFRRSNMQKSSHIWNSFLSQKIMALPNNEEANVCVNLFLWVWTSRQSQVTQVTGLKFIQKPYFIVEHLLRGLGALDLDLFIKIYLNIFYIRALGIY